MSFTSCFICQNKFPLQPEDEIHSPYFCTTEFAVEFLCKLFNLPRVRVERFGLNETSLCKLCNVCGVRFQDAIKTHEELKTLELRIQRVKDELWQSFTHVNHNSRNRNDIPSSVASVQKYLFQCLSKCEVRLTRLTEVDRRKHLRSNNISTDSARSRLRSEQSQAQVPAACKDSNQGDPPDDSAEGDDFDECQDPEWSRGFDNDVDSDAEFFREETSKGSVGVDQQRPKNPGTLDASAGVTQERRRGRPRLPPDQRKPKHGRKIFDCHHCSQSFNRQRKLKEHLVSSHDDQLYSVCKFCGFNFQAQRRLASEISNESNASVGASAVNSNTTSKSSKSNPSDYVYVCGLNGCKLFYDSLPRLRSHHLAKCTENPTVQATLGLQSTCPHCNKVLSSINALKIHIATVHEKDYRYCCEVCGKGFAFVSQLTKHSTYHSTDYRFKCHECGKAFRDKHLFTVHQRRHTGELPYVCDICGKGFHMISKMKRHREGVHGEPKYPCQFCGNLYKSVHLRECHIRTVHKQQRQKKTTTAKEQSDVTFVLNEADFVPQNATIEWE